MKPDTALLRNNDPFYVPAFSRDLHYETELVVRINRVGKAIEERFAPRYYDEVGLGIDFTARDLQRECIAGGLPWEIGKAFDHSAALSPQFVPLAELGGDVQRLHFEMSLNDEVRQRGDTSQMIFGVNRVIAYVSQFVTLKIGDLIYTGTPVGVGRCVPEIVSGPRSKDVCYSISTSSKIWTSTFVAFMNRFNRYADRLDVSLLKPLFTERGERRVYGRGEPFLTAGSVPRFVAFVESGVFRYTCLDGRGNEHVVGYAFPDEYVCDYRSFICGTAAVVDIRAVAESVSYLLPCTELERYWESGIEGQRLGRRVAEELFAITYDRLLDFYCKTPEEHYLNLIDRYPGLVDVIPLKELASFIGVTPETVSHIRRKLSSKRKS